MALNTYRRSSLTGGGSGALDAIDGAGLAENDLAIVMTTAGNCYIYRLNASSGAAESSPAIISPDTNAGAKRWILADVFFASVVSANGIKFPSTQVPSADANTLDDYAEGSGAVTLTAGTSGTITMSATDTLRYTKIGRMVFVHGYLLVGSVSSPVGRLKLNGLPYTVANDDAGYAAGSVWLGTTTAVSGVTAFQAITIKNTTTAWIDGLSNTGYINLAPAIKANTQIVINMSYSV